MNKQKVYIASPYTNGWQIDNVRLQMDAMNALMQIGYTPFAPLLGHFFEFIYPQKTYSHNMLEWDIEWLKMCDFVVRIYTKDENGVELQSLGADKECKIAREYNIPVYEFYTIEEMKIFMEEKYKMNYTNKIKSHFEKILD